MDEQAKQLVMKRTDPAGGRALLIFNFSPEAQSIPIAGDFQPWRLVLWTGDAVYSGSPTPRPVETLTAGSKGLVALAGFDAAVFVK